MSMIEDGKKKQNLSSVLIQNLNKNLNTKFELQFEIQIQI